MGPSLRYSYYSTQQVSAQIGYREILRDCTNEDGVHTSWNASTNYCPVQLNKYVDPARLQVTEFIPSPFQYFSVIALLPVWAEWWKRAHVCALLSHLRTVTQFCAKILAKDFVHVKLAASAAVGSMNASPLAAAAAVGSKNAAPLAAAVGSRNAALLAAAEAVGSRNAAPLASAAAVGSRKAAPLASAAAVGSRKASPLAAATAVGSRNAAPLASAAAAGTRNAASLASTTAVGYRIAALLAAPVGSVMQRHLLQL
jgi:hypothetical protein